ncbi:MAG: M48 family peptidase [Gammaproteobacteria bacterium]|nr:M48 family peptidase [Gammaproteobacteria bacterium]
MLAVAGFSFFSYLGKRSVNPITGETQHVSLSQEQEVAMGLHSAPEMAAQFGGVVRDERIQRLVKGVGQKIVAQSVAASSGYPFVFHVLADDKTVNAFALPGGQIFITVALLSRLRSDDQLAGVLGHEVGHVLARHSAEHMAKQELTAGITGAVVMGAGSYEMGRVAQMVGGLINMKYGREDELESDRLGVCLMAQAGYAPSALIDVMKILAEASGGARQPEFASSHPSPVNRVARIEAHLADLEGACRFGE